MPSIAPSHSLWIERTGGDVDDGILVPRVGIEPTTMELWAPRSNRLS